MAKFRPIQQPECKWFVPVKREEIGVRPVTEDNFPLPQPTVAIITRMITMKSEAWQKEVALCVTFPSARRV
jgi:hypothetical protein